MWESATFIINGLVFVVIGLQLPQVLERIHDHKIGALLLYGVLFSAIVIVLRLLWTFPGAWVASLLQNLLQRQLHSRPPAREVFVAGWTGMRGVVSLAAAIAVPEMLADGRAFPQPAFRGMDESMHESASATALFAKPAGDGWSGMSVSDGWIWPHRAGVCCG